MATAIHGADLGVITGILPTAGAGTNLVTNGDFETNTTGWSASGSAVLARVTTDFVAGAACLDVTVNASTAGATTPVTLVIGTVYTLSFWVKVPTGKTVTVSILDAAGTPASPSVVVTGLTGAWQNVSITYQAGATSVTVRCLDSAVSAYPYDMFIDAVRLAVRSSRISGSITNAPANLV